MKERARPGLAACLAWSLSANPGLSVHLSSPAPAPVLYFGSCSLAFPGVQEPLCSAQRGSAHGEHPELSGVTLLPVPTRSLCPQGTVPAVLWVAFACCEIPWDWSFPCPGTIGVTLRSLGCFSPVAPPGFFTFVGMLRPRDEAGGSFL